MLTAKEASELTGKTKTTIIKAIKSGKLSANKNARGEWEIDKSELLRVYPEGVNQGRKVDSSTPPENSGLQAEIESLKRERERERRQLEQTINDLRQRLDQSEAERRRTSEQLTNLLTQDPKEKKPSQGRIGRAWAALKGSL